MSRRRLMVGKEYKYIKDAGDVVILNGAAYAGNLFNNYSSNSSLNFEVHFTIRVGVDDAWCGLASNYYNANNYWQMGVNDGYFTYDECYDGNLNKVTFSSLGKIKKGEWYTIDLLLPGNTNEAYCKINSDEYTKFTLSKRQAMSFSNNREIEFGNYDLGGVDLRGEITIKGFSSNGTTQNIGKWDIDDMAVGNIDGGYMNGSGGSPSSLKLSGASNTVYLGRE